MGEARRKAWHPCGNPPHGETDFYPLLAKVGNSPPNAEGGIFSNTIGIFHVAAFPERAESDV